MDIPIAKHYTFSLMFGSEGLSQRVNASVIRRLVSLFRELDSDAPQESDIYSDGIKEFHWRKPLASEKDIIDSIKTLGFDFRYTWIPEGRDHERLRSRSKNYECPNCGCYGPYEYGGICAPQIVESDWKVVKNTKEKK